MGWKSEFTQGVNAEAKPKSSTLALKGVESQVVSWGESCVTGFLGKDFTDLFEGLQWKVKSIVTVIFIDF